MSQFTDVRGTRGDLYESQILLDTREAVPVDAKGGNLDAVIEGDLVVAVIPTSNVGTASIFVNDVKVVAAQPYETDEDIRAFAEKCEAVVAELSPADESGEATEA